MNIGQPPHTESIDFTQVSAAPPAFWDWWNKQWRFRDQPDYFMQRQLDEALAVARRQGYRDARILDVGCGSGWLGNGLLPFGEVWGIDVSASTIAEGARRHPGTHLVCGDFLTADLPGPFDFIVSADAFATMADHEACMRRVATLLRPGGIFLLITQNPTVWTRRGLYGPAPTDIFHGTPAEWPSLRQIRSLMRPSFAIERVTTMDPGGNRGLLFWVENRYVRGGMGRLVGRERWRTLLEKAFLGREFIIEARRLPTN